MSDDVARRIERLAISAVITSEPRYFTAGSATGKCNLIANVCRYQGWRDCDCERRKKDRDQDYQESEQASANDSLASNNHRNLGPKMMVKKKKPEKVWLNNKCIDAIFLLWTQTPMNTGMYMYKFHDWACSNITTMCNVIITYHGNHFQFQPLWLALWRHTNEKEWCINSAEALLPHSLSISHSHQSHSLSISAFLTHTHIHTHN